MFAELEDLGEDAGKGFLKEVLSLFFQVPLQGGTVCPERQHLLSMADVSCSRDTGPPSGVPYSCPGHLGSGRPGLLQLPTVRCDILAGSSSLPTCLVRALPPSQLLAASVHTITGCDPFVERKWGGRAVLIAHFSFSTPPLRFGPAPEAASSLMPCPGLSLGFRGMSLGPSGCTQACVSPWRDAHWPSGGPAPVTLVLLPGDNYLTLFRLREAWQTSSQLHSIFWSCWSPEVWGGFLSIHISRGPPTSLFPQGHVGLTQLRG